MIIVKAYKLWKLKLEMKLAFYTTLKSILDNNKDIVNFAVLMFKALQDTDPEEFKDELIARIAHLAHEEAMKDSKDSKHA